MSGDVCFYPQSKTKAYTEHSKKEDSRITLILKNHKVKDVIPYLIDIINDPSINRFKF
ncbi:hypothetical protein VAEU17_280012 [Vibrio aestuarianus]|nr:hypothetical protein VAEU17_280012 [Vibrio aestuarianus]